MAQASLELDLVVMSGPMLLWSTACEPYCTLVTVVRGVMTVGGVEVRLGFGKPRVLETVTVTVTLEFVKSCSLGVAELRD